MSTDQPKSFEAELEHQRAIAEAYRHEEFGSMTEYRFTRVRLDDMLAELKDAHHQEVQRQRREAFKTLENAINQYERSDDPWVQDAIRDGWNRLTQEIPNERSKS